jgi:hypothetical protein
VANGYSGHFPPHHGVLKRLLDEGDHDALRHLAQFGDLEVTVEHAYDDDGRWRRYVESYPGVEPIFSDDRYASFRVRQSDEGLRHRPRRQPALAIASITVSEHPERARLMTDGDLVTRWELGRGQQPGDRLTVDLGRATSVRALELAVGRYAEDYPRRALIETSSDGIAWQQAWSGSGGGPALTAAMIQPTVMPVTFPVHVDGARYVRVTQLGSHPVFYWSVAEIRVYGP